MDPARITRASEFVSIGRRVLGMEELLAVKCPCCEALRVNTRHERTCQRAGAQVNQHQPLVHALSRTFKRLSICHQVESGEPFNADRSLRMDIVERGDLRDATSSEYRNKAILLDVTHADPQARVHMRNGRADRDGSAASTSEARNRNHCARVRQVSFDEHSHKLATLAVESFGCLGKEGSEHIVGSEHRLRNGRGVIIQKRYL